MYLEMIMTEKSHVSMEQRVCLICGTNYETGALLLDRCLRATLEQFTLTGWGLCPEHQALFDKGFVALVEIDPARSGTPLPGDRLRPEQAYRTGPVLHMRREAFAEIFSVSADFQLPFVFVEIGAIEKLQALVEASASS
jgi:hypothetical protein